MRVRKVNNLTPRRKISPRAPLLLLNCCYNPKNSPRHPQTAPVARAGLLPSITGNGECHQECAITNYRLARQVSTCAAGVSIPPSPALNGPVIQLVAGTSRARAPPRLPIAASHPRAAGFQRALVCKLRRARCQILQSQVLHLSIFFLPSHLSS